MDDYLVRVFARDAGVRAFACITTNLVEEARKRHETPPAASAALAEALTGGILFGTLLKVGQRVAIKFAGSESDRKIVVESGNNGKIRGYATLPEDDVLLSDSDFNAANFIEPPGNLTVVKDLRLKNLYESVVPVTGEGIAADLNGYLNQSEQIPSVLEVGIIMSDLGPEAGQIKMAGGVLVQALPPYEAETVYRLGDRIQEMPPVEVMLQSGQTPEDILAAMFGDIEYQILETIPLLFSCSCSRERSEKALISLGREELVHLLENDGQALVDCHFCYERYVFDEDDLRALIKTFGE